MCFPMFRQMLPGTRGAAQAHHLLNLGNIARANCGGTDEMSLVEDVVHVVGLVGLEVVTTLPTGPRAR